MSDRSKVRLSLIHAITHLPMKGRALVRKHACDGLAHTSILLISGCVPCLTALSKPLGVAIPDPRGQKVSQQESVQPSSYITPRSSRWAIELCLEETNALVLKT